ncbi:CGNR zinc finger domain-containing protein [Streptomyces sp. NPDC088560]|uniref:CGNR zinc finger domain-containing protein n=1 Tax=Streptomyces sp. NPDC088560 TaxID=3365868 RepID=UPI00381C813D
MTTTGHPASAAGAEPGEPLAVEFANTLFRSRGRLRDDIAATDQLAAWLQGHATALGLANGGPLADVELTDTQTADFLALRDAIRSLIRAATENDQAREEDLAHLNACAATAPHWVQLRFGKDGFTANVATDRPPVPAALAALAGSTAALLAGPERHDLRACHAPGCMMFFLKDHPRREWCSAGCGNRARAARHYLRHRER